MNIMRQDEMTVLKLNELLLEMKTDFLSAKNQLPSQMGYSEILFNGKTKEMIPRRSSFHGKMTEFRNNYEKRQRKNSLPNLPSPSTEERNPFLDGHSHVDSLIDKLNGLLDHLETIGEQGPYDLNGGIRDERYILDDATRYFNRTLSHPGPHDSSITFPRPRFPSNTTYYKHSNCGFIKKFSSDGMIHKADEHSTLCRRLKTVEASYGITLKKELHFTVKTRMKAMNVSGCVYCMYSFYEKHKRDADDKAKQIRNTIKEQEYLQQKLNEQKQQSDADGLWLESEEQFQYTDTVGDGTDKNQRHSWREGLHESGSKSDSEQLGYDLYKEDYARDILEKKLAKKSSPLRRSIPFERSELTRDQTPSPLSEVLTVSAPSEYSTIAETSDSRSDISTPSVTVTDSDSLPVAQSIENIKSETTNVENNFKLQNSDTTCDYAKPHKYGDDNNTAKPPRCNPTGQIEREKRNTPVTRTRSNELPCSSGVRTAISTSSNNNNTVRNNDDDIVYQHTTSVVKSVLELNTGVQHAQPEEFVDLVKVVGLNLRDLLAAVDKDINEIPSASHKEIEMAHRVLSSDMAELVSKMKIAQKYADTTLDQENRRNMLQAAHALAIDAKNLYDTYSKLKSTSDTSNTS